MPQHIGIVACSAEGAALCYRTLCIEGAQLLGPHAHPEVTLRTHMPAAYMGCIYRGDRPGVGELIHRLRVGLSAYIPASPASERIGPGGHAGLGQPRDQSWLKIVDESLIGPNKAYLCGDRITLADYMGAEIIALGALVRCICAACPNIERWLRNMKSLKSWPKVRDTIDGFAASLKDKSFVTI